MFLRPQIGSGTILLLLLISPCVPLLGCGEGQQTIFFRSQAIMGTIVEIKIANVSPELANEAFDAAFAAVHEVDELMSTYIPESEISRLNQNGRGILSPLTVEVLKQAREVYGLTGGAFDVTVAPLLKLYDYENGETSHFPDESEIEMTRKLVGMDKLIIKEKNGEAYFALKGMSVDLGGIAKGFAVDHAVKALRDVGVSSAIVNAGGDGYYLGEKSAGKPWMAGLRDPRVPERLLGAIPVTDMALVTSGDYEKFFLNDGKRYSHIIDPRTGHPAEGGVASATVLCPESCALADALATAVSVLGAEEGARLLESLDNVEGVVAGDMVITTGIAGKFKSVDGQST